MLGGTTRIVRKLSTCLCCLAVIVSALADTASAAPANQKSVRVTVVGADQGTSRTELAYSTNSQPITKLALQGGVVTVPAAGDKLVLYVDSAASGSAVLRLELPDSPQVNVTVHVDGKIHADVTPVVSGKRSDQAAASTTNRRVSAAGKSVTKPNHHFAANADAQVAPGKSIRPVAQSKNTLRLGAPANDNCASAIAVGNGTTGFSNLNSTTDGPDEPTSCTFFGYTQVDSDIWYCYTAACDGLVTVSLCGSLYDTKVAVYSGCGTCPTSESAIACNDDFCSLQSSVTFAASNGSQYLIRIGGYQGEQGDGTMDISCAAGCDSCAAGSTPEGEADCGLPTDTFNGGCNSIPPVFSPIDCGDKVCGTGAFDGSLRDTDWYEVTLTQQTFITWKATADFDLVVGIVDNQGGALDCSQVTAFLAFALAGRCQEASVTACLQPGTWWLFVGADFTSTVACGAIYNAELVCEECPPGPANDHCVDAEPLLCDSSVTVDNTFATTDVDDPAYSCHFGGPGQGVGTLWYTFVATDTSAILTTCNSAATDTLLAVYSGTCGSLVEIACNDDASCGPIGLNSTLCASGLIVGNTYYIQLSSFSPADVGSITLELTCPCPAGPANDHCVDAAPLACNSSADVDNTFATTDVDDPFYSCAFFGPQQGFGTVWYTFQATDTSAYLQTCNSLSTDTLLAVYSGTCGSLVELACNDDGPCGGNGLLSKMCVSGLTVGNTYYVQVGSFSLVDQGQITLELTCPCPAGPPGDNCDDAVALTLPADVSGSTANSNPDPQAFTCNGFSVTAPGNWYTVVGDGTMLTASLCNPGTLYDTKIHVYCGTCTQFFCVTADDDACGFPPGFSEASWCSASGTTYYILVSGFSSSTGDYQLTVTSGAACSDPPSCEPCVVTCDPGKTDENEPDCGLPADTVNGGCNSALPVFSPITCGEAYCGTAAFDGSLRDTDWYEVTLTQPTQVTWTVEAEFDVLVGIVDNGGGALDCSQVTSFLVFTVGTPCQATSVSTCLSAGTWWLFVAPDFTAPVPCGAIYNAELTCDDCPPGPPNDLCEDAEAILCNSTTNLDNTLATTDASDPLYSCAFFGPQQGFGTLWYTFVATNSSARLSTCGSASTDTLLAVYSGTCGSLVEIACNDDLPCGPTTFLSELCVTGLTVGNTYYVQVSSFSNADRGPIELVLECPCPGFEPTGACCVNDVCTVTTQSSCAGVYLGDGTNCDSVGGSPSNYVSNPNAAIPDNDPGGLSDTINVPDSITIGDVNVDLSVTHTWVGDLIVTLTHGPTTVTLVDRPGVPASSFGCSEDNYNIILDDQGTGGSIESACAPNLTSPPNYVPSNLLAAFNGADASGPWILTISDNAGQDVGTLVQWSLHIDVPGQSPCNIEPCDDCPAGTIPIVDGNGDHSGWCVSASDPANVVIIVEDVDRPAGTATIHINKNFVNPPGFGGLLPCILLDFVQVCPDVRTVDTIIVNGETITNNTGVNWLDFHWILFDGPEAWFDVAASDEFDVLPFLSKLFSRFIDSPANNKSKRLDAYNGIVPAGGVFSPTGGTVVGGSPVDVVETPNVAIPDNSPGGVSDDTTVVDSVTISDLNVDLVVTHTWVGDLIVTLTHGSTTVTLVDRPGVPASSFGCSEDNYDILLDDQGSGGTIESLCSVTMVSPPNYVPSNPLAAFNGADSAGLWTITVSDNAGQDIGTLVQWSLHITPETTSSGEPLTIGVDLSGPQVSFTLKECPTTTGQVFAGACCLGLDCMILAEEDCVNSQGIYKGDGSVCTPLTCLPANDDCNNCIPLQNGVPYVGSTLGATGTDISSCAFNDALDVWHCWTAPCTGPAAFSLCGSAFDTTLAVYSSCGGAELGCNDDDTGGCSPQSKLTLNVVSGQTYYIRVAGFNLDAGNYSLSVTCTVRSKGVQTQLNRSGQVLRN